MVLRGPGLGAGVGAVVLTVTGRILGLEELFALAAGVLTLMIVSALYTATRALDVAITRTPHPHRIHVGANAVIELVVTNRTGRRTPVLRLHDPVTDTVGASLVLAPLHPDESASATYRLPAERRGLVDVGPLSVESVDPFGLTTRRQPAVERVTLTILPHVDDLAPLGRSTGPDTDGGVGHTAALGRQSEEFASLRPYSVGDDLRRVHWPSSARVDDLIVRQDDVPRQGRVTVILDLRRSLHDDETVERAVSAAASVARTHLRRGDQVRLIDSTGHDSGFGAGPGHLVSTLEHLAIVQPSAGNTDLDGLVDRAEGGRVGGRLVLVTGRPVASEAASIDRAVLGPGAMRVLHFTDEPVEGRGNGTRRPSGVRRTRRSGEVIGIDSSSSLVDRWSAVTVSSRRRRESLAT